ncbi:MAG: transcription antitermination factor NusB [Rhodothalassiaceae bacterium]
MTDALAPRRAAIDILDAVIRRRQTLDVALDVPRFRVLEGRDRAFAHALAMAVLRHRGFITAALKRRLGRPLPPEAWRTRFCLMAGIAQILFLDVPDHAAVSTSVALLDTEKRALDRRHKGLANAVLRRIADARASLLAALETDPTMTLPPLFRARWRRIYGPDRTDAIARALACEPPLDLSPRDPADAPALAARLGGILLPGGTIRIRSGGDIAALPGFAEGAFWVQDAAAALAARLFEGPDAREIVDLCAAPGGKTMQLAALGHDVLAIDRSDRRLALLRDSLARTGLKARLQVADALDWRPGHPVPAILLDAPCSATGTARRHPEVLWTRSAEDITKRAAFAARLLDHAADLLAPQGTLVFCVCSLEPEEGEQQIADFLARRRDFVRHAVTAAEIADLAPALLATGDVRTTPELWPELGGLDGFFIARLRKHPVSGRH